MRGHLLLLAAITACGGKERSGEGADASAAPPPTPPADAAVAPAEAGAPAPTASAVPCYEIDERPPVDDPAAVDHLTLKPVAFTALPGWADDRHAEAVPAFLASCGRLADLADDDRIGVDGRSGRARDWRAACTAAARLKPGDHAAARAFFESEFRAYAASGRSGPDGKMTGYNVQALRGSRTRKGRYQTPIYGRPPYLVSVDLSKFIPDARARKIWGQVDAEGTLQPMPTRAEIRAGALAGKGLELVWVDDPIDALFANIEGSGVVHMDDGSSIRIEFAGKNGRAYRGVAAVLRSLGPDVLPKGSGTMQGIRAWFQANPGRIHEVLDQIPSMVFFKLSDLPGAHGSQGVVLIGGRSIAVDRNFVAHSTPVWIDTRAPVPGKQGNAPWRQLTIAQDTGGGIKGAVRADIYWGDDADAADRGGRMGGRGRYWLLLPRTLNGR